MMIGSWDSTGRSWSSWIPLGEKYYSWWCEEYISIREGWKEDYNVAYKGGKREQ